jgi:hypothetical protein
VRDETKVAAPLRSNPNVSALLPSDIQSMRLATAEVDIRIETLQSLMKFLDQDYTEALKSLRPAFGERWVQLSLRDDRH